MYRNFSPYFLLAFPILLFLLTPIAPAWADDGRIEAEIKDTTPLPTPLTSALGKAEYDKAIQSGEYSYSGNLKCRLCHRGFFMGRKKDAHSHSFKKSIKKEHRAQPRCLPCHTTGFGVASGFTSLKKTPKLANVQCEGCHGPGSKHNDLGKKGGFLAGTDHPKILKKMCRACHNSRWNKSYENLDKAYEAYKEAEGAAASK